MDRESILRRLEAKVRITTQQRERAARDFADSTRKPNAIPYPDSVGYVHCVSEKYQRAIRAAEKAFMDQTNFVLKGIVPPDLSEEDQAPQDCTERMTLSTAVVRAIEDVYKKRTLKEMEQARLLQRDAIRALDEHRRKHGC